MCCCRRASAKKKSLSTREWKLRNYYKNRQNSPEIPRSNSFPLKFEALLVFSVEQSQKNSFIYSLFCLVVYFSTLNFCCVGSSNCARCALLFFFFLFCRGVRERSWIHTRSTGLAEKKSLFLTLEIRFYTHHVRETWLRNRSEWQSEQEGEWRSEKNFFFSFSIQHTVKAVWRFKFISQKNTFFCVWLETRKRICLESSSFSIGFMWTLLPKKLESCAREGTTKRMFKNRKKHIK